MSMPTNGGAGAMPPESAPQPQLMVLAQYVKDFSFENPNAPASLNPSQQPQINVSINVNARPMNAPDTEVELKLEGRAEIPGSVLFSFELVYGGVFRLQNVPDDAIAPLTLIECPRLLFPFAREIVANAVRNGGFPPLMLDPIDFVSLYQQRMAQEQQQTPPQPPMAS